MKVEELIDALRFFPPKDDITVGIFDKKALKLFKLKPGNLKKVTATKGVTMIELRPEVYTREDNEGLH